MQLQKSILDWQNYHLLLNFNFRVAELNHDNLTEAANLLAEMFITNNKIWATIKPTLQEIHAFMYAKTQEMLQWQQQLRDQGIIGKRTFINFVYLDESGKIVGVWTNFDLCQYLNKQSNVYLPQFNILQTYGLQLEKSIDKKDVIPGLSIYGMFSAVKPEIIGSGVTTLFWIDISHHLYQSGFRILYGRSSNIKSLILAMKLGAHMTEKMKVVQNDKILTLSFFRLQLLPIYRSLYLGNKILTKASL